MPAGLRHSWFRIRSGGVAAATIPGQTHRWPGCGALMDGLGLHAARRARHTGQRRHNDVRDRVAQCARGVGVTATVEQNWSLEDAGARPTHIADIHLIDQQASEMWLDVRISAAALDAPIKKALGEAEAKKRQYRQPRAHPSLLHHGVIP